MTVTVVQHRRPELAESVRDARQFVLVPAALETEVMDSLEEARAYDAMDHAEVNRVFVADFLAFWPASGTVLDVGSGAGAGTADRFSLTAANFAPVDVLGGDFGAFGRFDWAIPAVVLSVPGLLLFLALLTQATVGFVWLPLVRRRLGEFGFGRRRHRERADR